MELKRIKLSNHTRHLTLNLEKVEEIADDLHDREDADADSDEGDTGLHVIIGDLLLILDSYEPHQEVVPLVHLIS